MMAVSFAYSMDGKALAVVGSRISGKSIDAVIISTYNFISGTHVYSHCVSEGESVVEIWTHGESFRFATMKPGFITIWEAGFTLEHTLAEIESLPTPDNTHLGEHLFLPTPSRLAFILEEAVLIWDARDSKFLLNFMGGDRPRGFSFSSNGCLFACIVLGQGVHLWKESPTGYALHRKFGSNLQFMQSLSPDGESIILSNTYETQLWRMTDLVNPPSSVPTQPAEQTNFVLAFSPDKSLIATGRLGENIATIVDLKSGDSRLIVDVGMKIWGLGVTANTAIVIGEGKIVTWNLPTGDCVLEARANIHDSVQTIVFDHPPPPSDWPHSASISPDFNYLVITREEGEGLDIYDMATGGHLVGSTTLCLFQPWFTRDGREVWSASYGNKIIRGGGSNVIGLEPLWLSDDPSGGQLWESSYGHKVTDDGWILDSRKKRVMWLPHNWRVFDEHRIWNGQFLALFGCELPEPVIIELYE